MRTRSSALLALTLLAARTLPAQRDDVSSQEWESRVWLPPLVALQQAPDSHSGYALWPFIHWRREGAEREWGIRPLWHWHRDPNADRLEFDILWPLIRYGRDGDHLEWRLFPLSGGWRVNRRAGDPERYFRLFPLVWIQRDPLHASAVIPPYVRIREREEGGLLRFDALLPFWRSVDEETGETSTSLFPVIWGSRNGELTYLLIFPFYWNWIYGASQFHALLPFWGEFRDVRADGTLRQRTRMVLPPLYVDNFYSGGRERRHHLLWPLFAWGRGENTRLVRAFPLFSYQVYSQSGRDYESHDLFILPVLIASHYQGGELYERRVTSLLSWHWWGPDLGDRLVTSWGLYPLVNCRSTEGIGTSLSVFDPLFFLRDSELHERYAPLYRLFHHEHSAERQMSRTELLWRLFYHERRGERMRLSIFPLLTRERSPERSKTSILWRLFEWNREPEGRSVRVFFSPRIRLGGNGSGPAPSPQP